MLRHNSGLWRIEFRSDLTRSAAETFRVGFMLEAHWDNGDRWLGMLFRKRLTAVELDHVDVGTWPELEQLETYMTGLFDEAWSAVSEITPEGDVPRLGSGILAKKFPVQSALHFASETSAVDLDTADPEKSFKDLYVRILGLRSELTPLLTAPVVPFPARLPARVPQRPDVEHVARAA